MDDNKKTGVLKKFTSRLFQKAPWLAPKKIFGYVILFLFIAVAVILIYNKLTMKSMTTKGNALNPKAIIETFEVSSLDYQYSDVIFSKVTDPRKFLFIKLSDAVQMYAVKYSGSIKLGINGKDIKHAEHQEGEVTITTLTIPKAYQISHEAPLNDSVEVIYDIAEHTENVSVEQYLEDFEANKKKTEAEIQAAGLYEKAQESAKKQLEALFNSISESYEGEYKFEFVLE